MAREHRRAWEEIDRLETLKTPLSDRSVITAEFFTRLLAEVLELRRRVAVLEGRDALPPWTTHAQDG